MSYDIHLVSPWPSESVADAASRDEVIDEPFSQSSCERNARVVAAVLRRYPSFEVSESHECVELTDLEEGSGMQLSLFNSSGAITVPYWSENEAQRVLQKLNDLLLLVLENSELAAFDPQTERELTPQSGLAPSTATSFNVGVSAIQDVPKRPWWRMW